jgi:hypothetical protein
MKVGRLCWWNLVAVLAISMVTVGHAARGATFTTLLLSGTEAPGIPGTVINSFGVPKINNVGQVAITVVLKADAALGINSNTDGVLYSGFPGAVGIVAREAAQAPTFPSGVNFITRSNPAATALSDDGQVIFSLPLATNAGAGITESSDSLTWIGSPGAVARLMREGDPPPGLPGLTIDSVGSSLTILTNTGKVYQQQQMLGPGVTSDNGGTALFAGTTPANLTPIIRTGSAPPDGPSGTVFQQFLAVKATGNHLLVEGSLLQGQGGVTPANDQALWATNGSGNLNLVLREGGFVTGPPELVDPGTQISTFDEMGINKSGTILTWGSKLLVDGVHVSSSNDTVVLIGTAATGLSVIAREGTPAPGLPGINYGSSFSEARIADNGNVLIFATLAGSGVTGANDGAFFKGTPDHPQLLVREGDQAPGFAPGNFIQEWGTSDFLIDEAGMFALIDTVSNGTSTSEAIFVTNPATGQLELLVKQGDSLEVAPGIFKIISDLTVGFGPSSQSANAQHQLTFTATFTDGTSGAFIAAVPEPSSVALLSVAGFAVFFGFARTKRVA